MNYLRVFLIALTFSLASSTTKFIILGSLGDLAKKYLWSALEENVWNSKMDIELLGASRNPPSEGEVMLAEILDKLPKRELPLDGLEEKVNALFSHIPDGKDILSESKTAVNDVLQKLNVAGNTIQEKANDFLKKVPQTNEDMKDAFSHLYNVVSGVGLKVLSGGQETLLKFQTKFLKLVSGFVDDAPQSSNELMTIISVLLKNSGSKLSESRTALINLVESVINKGKPFQDRVKYLQLKTEDHYSDFCSSISHDLVIFYLSIPPSAYIRTSELISKHCKKDGVQIRVAYEKPFGYNLHSAKSLFTALEQLIGKDDIYLVDHYLGKSITQQIPVIRTSHSEVESLLTGSHVTSVYISLLEAADCEGRAGYYEKSGVFRDMLQNHAMELLMLTAADVNSESFAEAKVEFLQSLTRPNKHQVVAAQYYSYQEHAGAKSTTPTFASVLFMSNLTRWNGVQFILTSGKSQSADQKDIVINFKSGERLHVNFKSAEITFKGKSLLPKDFTASRNSYTTLLKNVIAGDKTLLPDLDTVLASWSLWDHVIGLKYNLLLHPDRRNMAVENHGKFLIAGYTENPLEQEHVKFFNKAFMISDHEERLYEHMVHDIIRVIGETLEHSDQFHLAVSGGSTVLGVYKYFVAHYDTIADKGTVPWRDIHIWQVDERCDITKTNAHDLKNFLLDEIPEILSSQVHLMPVTESGCGDIDAYQEEFNTINPERKFNYIILGVGSDGHTASLFPQSKTSFESADFKQVLVETDVSPNRLTITFDLINRSDWVSILVTGADKGDIVRSIRQGQVYPVSRVSNSHLTWFIDQILL